MAGSDLSSLYLFTAGYFVSLKTRCNSPFNQSELRLIESLTSCHACIIGKYSFKPCLCICKVFFRSVSKMDTPTDSTDLTVCVSDRGRAIRERLETILWVFFFGHYPISRLPPFYLLNRMYKCPIVIRYWMCLQLIGQPELRQQLCIFCIWRRDEWECCPSVLLTGITFSVS